MAGVARAENVGSRMSGLIMKQLTFDWSAKDRYVGGKKLQTIGNKHAPKL